MGLYPSICLFISRTNQTEEALLYQHAMNQLDAKEKEQNLKMAQEYNKRLYQKRTGDYEEYLGILSMTDEGVMGCVEIPKINVYLPIYHGTSEEILEKGAGHVYGTSFPVSGEDTHSVIVGHRGLPTAEIFKQLDELKEGDLFYIHVLGERLTYQVREIQIVKPEDSSVLEIQTGKSLVSLITCTPYGINTHRLVVTGEKMEEDDGK